MKPRTMPSAFWLAIGLAAGAILSGPDGGTVWGYLASLLVAIVLLFVAASQVRP